MYELLLVIIPYFRVLKRSQPVYMKPYQLYAVTQQLLFKLGRKVHQGLRALQGLRRSAGKCPAISPRLSAWFNEASCDEGRGNFLSCLLFMFFPFFFMISSNCFFITQSKMNSFFIRVILIREQWSTLWKCIGTDSTF